MDNPTQPDNTNRPVTPPNTATPPDNNGGNTDERLLTQADVDRLISERLKRDRDAQQSKLFESLGVTSVDDLKSMLDAKRKADEAQLSELEKIQAQLDSERKQREDALKQVEDMKAKQIADNRRASLLDAIRTSGGSNESQLYILVNASMQDEFTGIFDGDSTSPDDGKLKAFIKTVQSKFPMYFGTAGAGSPSNQDGVPANRADFTKQAEDEWRKQLRR